MATGYRIEVGYNPDGQPEQHWQQLVVAVETICRKPKVIEQTAKRFGCPDGDGEFDLYDYCTIYQTELRDGSPLSVYGPDSPEIKTGLAGFDTPFVGISCSGGDVSRVIKEHVARAFCYLVFEQMAAQGINISITVG